MRARAIVVLSLGLLVAGAPATAAPTDQLQNLKWFVVQGIGGGEGLAFYQAVIDQGMAEAKLLLQGDQGPVDAACCVDLRRLSASEVALSTLRVVDGAADYNDMDTICANSGGGSCAFLVDEVSYCGGFSPNSIGCADTPSCASNVPGDNPQLVLVVALEAQASGSFAQTIAHERGHNACLQHVAVESCQLMRASAGGGCIDAAECGHLRDAGNGVGPACGCHDDQLGPVVDGLTCVDGAIAGQCSGGVCGESGSDAGIRLLAAGAPEFPAAGPTDETLWISGLSGGWSDVGGYASPVHDLDFAASRDAVYAVTAADQVVRIDPATGATLATVATLPATGTSFLVGEAVRYDGLAFDPGPSAGPGDDVLYAVRQAESCDDQDFCDSELVAVAPDSGVTSFLGDLNTSFLDGVQSLAFDSGRDRLYASASAFGSVFEIDPGCGGPLEFCSVLDVTEIELPRIRSSLAYSGETDRLYLVGTQVGDTLYYDSIDAGSFAYEESIGIDAFRPGGIAALSVPEPGAAAPGAALLALLVLGRLREHRGR